jgi:hypothetical protein
MSSILASDMPVADNIGNGQTLRQLAITFVLLVMTILAQSC